ncbi:MAG: MFS transporter [Spirochaetaceae bacterium]|nr:MFS transporter [Spirochaetaceae bacterium]
MATTVDASESSPGLGKMASYGVGKFLAEFLTGGIASLVFKFYETEVKLSAGLVALVVVAYSLWNAVNDPLIGFMTSRPTRLTARLGRRFPWILLGSMTCGLLFFLVFSPPSGLSQVGLFIWFIVAICAYDALYSTWELNYQSVFPDMFRSEETRAKAAGISTAIGILGIAAGAVVPTFFIKYGIPSTYVVNAAVFAVAALALAALLVPGTRESPAMISRYLEQEKARAGAPSFWKLLVQAVKVRDFMAFILLFFFYQSATLSMTASIHYVGDYILGRSTTLIFAGMLAGALAAVPIWLGLSKKIQSRQSLLAAAAASMSILCLPLLFVRGYWGFVAAKFGWGLAFGGFWLMMTPALADVVDEIVATTGMRDDGVFLGFRAFFGRLAYAVQALSFWAVHQATGFALDPRSASAVNGIRIHLALLPSIFLAIGVLVFLRMNGLNASKAAVYRKELADKRL